MKYQGTGTESTRKTLETLVLVAGVGLFLLFVYLIIPVLSPLVLVAAIVFLLYPARRIPYVHRLIWLAVLLLFLWFLSSAAAVLAPFIIAFLLAYVLNPLVNVLERRNFRRWQSSLLLMVFFLALVVTSLVLLMPIVFVQFKGIIESVSILAKDAIELTKTGKIYDLLAQYGVPSEQAREILEKQLPLKLESIVMSLLQGALGFVTGVSSVITQLLNVIIIPFLTFYLLKDFPHILHRIRAFIPENRREGISAYIAMIDGVLGHYFRGAIIVAIIQGVISTIVLSLLGVRYALVLGIMTAILDFIPYVGLLISLVVSSIAALLSAEPTTTKLVGVVIMYLSQKIFENTVLAPKIIGSKVGLHPVLLILSLFIFGYFLGFIGLLIAVPTAAVIVQSVLWWEEKRAFEAKTQQVEE